ncbi:transcription factor IIA alpha beta subunit [Pisolithus croceorrhizus]|nr:transcription factor IIA alpha beta subunit [Pisolithus croceorrhizus]
MSNKIVRVLEPVVYRQVIDEVIAAVKPEFDEFGVSEDVLADLQHKWQSKVIASRVADFEPPQQPSQHPVYPAHPIHMMQHHPHYPPPHNPYVPPQQQAQPTQVKTEPVDNRYILSAPTGVSYALPPLPGPQLNGVKAPAYPGGQQGVLSFPPHPAQLARPTATPRTYAPPAPTTQAPSSSAQTTVIQTQQGTPPQPTPSVQPRPPSTSQKIPQADGPSSSESGSPSPPPNQSYAPRPSHPSLPQPSQTSGTQPGDSEAINSDLDDSDTEGEEDAEEGGQGDTDIVFCTYDKVGRVKNKWKCILKDGMIHVNGKDYVFAKCTGEFEW